MNAKQQRMTSLRDRGLARNKSIESVDVLIAEASSVFPDVAGGKTHKVINLVSKCVRALPPTDRKAMEEAASDPFIRRQFPVIKIEDW